MPAYLVPSIPLTILAEGIVLWLWCRKRPCEFGLLLLVLTIANLFTQALLILSLVLSPFRYWPTLLAMEVIIVLLEALPLRIAGLSFRSALVLSLLVNAVSFTIGLLLPI